jgi:hypothetical protein
VIHVALKLLIELSAMRYDVGLDDRRSNSIHSLSYRIDLLCFGDVRGIVGEE